MKYLFILILAFSSYAWSQDSISDETLKKFKSNQYKLDLNHGGIGPTFFKPRFGKGVSVDNYWYGVDMLTDILQFRLAFGNVSKDQAKTDSYGYTYPYGKGAYGYDKSFMFYAGVNVPLNFGNFGSQKNAYQVFRGHPTAGAGFGWYRFNRKNSASDIYYLGLNPGYRIRFPFGSVELNLETVLGLSSQSSPKFYNSIGIYPSITLRIDAMKGLLNPDMISIPSQQVSVSNVQSDTRLTGSRYNSTGTRIDTYTTTTTGDVNVTNMNIGVQDIGPYFGFGPKFSFNSYRQTDYIERGYLIGVCAEGRGGPLDLGLTLEGGKVGHGNALEAKPNDEFKRKIDRGRSEAAGSVGMVSLYLNAGIDISQVFLIPFGIVMDKGKATSFFSIMGGMNFGVHQAFNQRYNANVEPGHNNYIPDNDIEIKSKYLDPNDVGFGYVGGFYVSVQIGAMNFKFNNLRYYGAPFASTTMYSIAYRFPIKIRG